MTVRSWSSGSVASRLQHRIFYTSIRLGGRGVAYFMLFFVVLWYTASPRIRARSTPYLLRRFPRAGRAAMLRHAFRLNLAFGLTLVDRAVAGITGDFAVRATEADKRAVLDLLAEGRGLVLLTAHVGNWQAALSGLDFTNAPKAIVMHRADADVDRHYYEHGGGEAPFTVIDPAGPLGGALEMMDVLRGGGMLCGMGDRAFGSGRGTLDVDFLGGSVRVPWSFYRIAAAMGAPVAVLFTRRTGPGTVVIELARVLRVAPDSATDSGTVSGSGAGRAPRTYLPQAREFAAALEGFVHEEPYQFFNFYDLWKETDTAHG